SLLPIPNRAIQRIQSPEFRSAGHPARSGNIRTYSYGRQRPDHSVRAQTVLLNSQLMGSMKTADQNASSLALYIGKTGALRCEFLSVDVTVADAKRSYGRTLLLVRPTSGTSEQWVEESRISWI